jgi:hypothetical protein
MHYAIAFLVKMRPGANVEEFESAFREGVQDARTRFGHGQPWPPEFHLYGKGDVPGEFVWITRFSEEELDRVTRAAWPFVLLATADIIKRIRPRFTTEMTCLSACVTSPQELVDNWNDRFGRFTRLTLDAADSAPPREDEEPAMAKEHPTNEELTAVMAELKRWRVERFGDRASRQVLKFFPPEGDAIHEPFEVRLVSPTR